MPEGDGYEYLGERLNARCEQARLPGKFISIGAQKARLEAGDYDLAGFFANCNPAAVEIPWPTGLLRGGPS